MRPDLRFPGTFEFRRCNWNKHEYVVLMERTDNLVGVYRALERELEFEPSFRLEYEGVTAPKESYLSELGYEDDTYFEAYDDYITARVYLRSPERFDVPAQVTISLRPTPVPLYDGRAAFRGVSLLSSMCSVCSWRNAEGGYAPEWPFERWDFIVRPDKRLHFDSGGARDRFSFLQWST